MNDGFPKELLEPISTMCRIISLNFSEIGTKINIKNHILYLDKPHNYQCISRCYNGYTRDHISDLFGAIYRIVNWYLLPLHKIINENKNNTDNINEENITLDIILSNKVNINIIRSFYETFCKLVKYMINGLSQLQKTYSYGNVIFTLQYYKILLISGLNGDIIDKMLPEFIIKNEYKNLLDYNKILKLWTDKKLENIYDLFNKCFLTNQKKLIDCYLKAVESILHNMDEKFIELIIHSSII